MDHFHTITTSNMKHLYYSINQFIAHHTVSGCNMNTGDMLGTGTISSAVPESGCGSLMERQKLVSLPDGTERKYLQDGDEINLHGYAKGKGFMIGFGGCGGKVLPCRDDTYFE